MSVVVNLKNYLVYVFTSCEVLFQLIYQQTDEKHESINKALIL